MNFKPYTIVPRLPSWTTPGFNPDAKLDFTPITIVLADNSLSPQTQAGLLRLEQENTPGQEIAKPLTPQTMYPTINQVQLPNGKFVTQEQYQKLMQKLKTRK